MKSNQGRTSSWLLLFVGTLVCGMVLGKLLGGYLDTRLFDLELKPSVQVRAGSDACVRVQEAETVQPKRPVPPPAPSVRKVPEAPLYKPGNEPPVPSLRNEFQVYVFMQPYRVVPGDTLWKIARRLGQGDMSVYDTLAEENWAILMQNWLKHCLARDEPTEPAGFCDTPEATLHAGMELYIPLGVLLRVVELPPGPEANLAY